MTMLEGVTVTITGETGSFGRTMAGHLLTHALLEKKRSQT